MIIFDTQGTKRAEHGWVLTVLAIDCLTLILLYFNYLTTEMQLIYIPETTSSTAFSLQYMSTHRCISPDIMGARRRKVGSQTCRFLLLPIRRRVDLFTSWVFRHKFLLIIWSCRFVIWFLTIYSFKLNSIIVIHIHWPQGNSLSFHVPLLCFLSWLVASLSSHRRSSKIFPLTSIASWSSLQ